MSTVPGARLTPVDEALTRLLADMEVVAGTENVAIKRSLNRVLAGPVDAPISVPGYDNSGMDGYALDSMAPQDVPLRVTQRIAAGSEGEALAKGTVARIFTGAPLPPGADAVVMQENCVREGDELRILQRVASGENVRRAGSDVQRGARLFEAGHRLRAPDVGMLAGVGMAWVEVRAPLRVALLTTGNELVRPGQLLAPGQIYNSNFYTLRALLRSLGHEILDCGIVPDSLAATEDALRAAAENTDCIISSGGVSAGEEDHVRQALERAGELTLWKLAIKPGKPFACGRILGLPGNPVSALVSWLMLGGAMTSVLNGRTPKSRSGCPMVAATTFDRRLGRTEFVPARLTEGPTGPALEILGRGGSARLRPLVEADGLAEIAAEHGNVLPGDPLLFHPFHGGFRL